MRLEGAEDQAEYYEFAPAEFIGQRAADHLPEKTGNGEYPSTIPASVIPTLNFSVM